MNQNRRKFIRTLSLTSALLYGLDPNKSYGYTLEDELKKIKISKNDHIRIGLIGCGIIGHYDASTALKVPGVELVAVADLYDERLKRAKEKWGKDLFITRDYREIIKRDNIDAVLICTPDHWHDTISIDAMNAGKHVYCEKPMVQEVEEGFEVVKIAQKTGKVFQVGSQRASSVVSWEAKKYFEAGIIGDITYAEAYTDRSTANGAWQYTLPKGASEKNIDWERFLKDTPKIPFDPIRFFRWRNFKAYGTGVAGDLFVHNFTGLHTITSSLGPTKIYAQGALNYWKDGRDSYDILTGFMTYPKTDSHNQFQFMTRVNLADGAGGGEKTVLVGTEGVIEVRENGLEISSFKRPSVPSIGGYDSLESYPKEMQEELLKEYHAKYGPEDTKGKFNDKIIFQTEKGYDSRLDHFIKFFDSIRHGSLVFEDAVFGLRAAAPSVLSNLSVEKERVIQWDPVNLKMS